MTLSIRPYHPGDEKDIIQLWLACGLVVPHNNPWKDIERKLKVNPEWFLLALLDGEIVGSCMAGYEGHRGWINYLAVAPQQQRQGIATALMAEAERLLTAAGCPKINLQVRETNLAVLQFYESIGYTNDAVVSLGKRLDPDEPYGD
ncbi:MAG: GNAT family acetyltransferase [Anaerolineae bacterium]|nr:GNAT family acetyltransferase [Anaerolineae bacterium]